MADYSNVSFKNNGKLKLLIIVGTRPEIIRLAAVINKTRKYFDVILAHTGQNYDYNLNGVFFHDLQLADPEVYMNAVGVDLGETMGNIIAESYKLMVAIQPDATFFSCKRIFIKEEEKSGRLDEEKDENSFGTIFCVLRWNSDCKHIF